MATRTALARRPARSAPSPPTPREISDPLEYLLNSGFIFEMNRVIFHPSGLSMSVRRDPKDPHKLRFALFDCGENPTVTFDPSDFERGQAKWKRWWRENGQTNHSLRQSMLGFTTQIKPDYRDQQLGK